MSNNGNPVCSSHKQTPPARFQGRFANYPPEMGKEDCVDIEMWAVITGAPMSVSVLVFLACMGTWIISHFLHKRQLDRISLLEERVRAKDEKIADLEKRSPKI